MATVVDISQRSRIEDEATLWIARIDRGLTFREEKTFQKWLVSDSLHYSIFMQFAEFWDLTESFNLAGTIERCDPSTKKESNSYFSRTIYGATAASVLIFVTVYFLQALVDLKSTTPFNEKIRYTQSFESKNEKIEKKLPDGSLLTLNAHSKVSVVFSNSYRNLTLSSGDIYIDVASDTDRPLTVFVKKHFFRAVGTAFLVSTKDGKNIEMLVTEGTVWYGKDKDLKNGSLDDYSNTAEHGVNVKVKDGSFDIKKLSAQEVDNKLNWKTAFIKFKGEPLSKVIKHFSQHSGKKIIILSKSLENEKITGRFKPNDIEGFLAMIEDGLDIQWHEKDNRIFLSKKQ